MIIERERERVQERLANYQQTIRRTVCDKMASNSPSFEDFETFRSLIQEHQLLSYENFKSIKSQAPLSVQKYFKTSIFAMFPKSKDYEIKCDEFLQYVARAVDSELATIDMYQFAKSSNISNNMISEVDFQEFLWFYLQNTPIFSQLHSSFVNYYIYAAARKFFFLLDTYMKGCLSREKIVSSSIFDELLAARQIQNWNIPITDNWFDPNNVKDLYSNFIDLDQDRNGTLSRYEFSRFAGTRRIATRFTWLAVDHLFETHVHNDSQELDFIGFVDVVLALESTSSSASLRYFWKILDFDGKHIMNSLMIQYFYQEVQSLMLEIGEDAPPLDNILVEIFDMIGCPLSTGARFEDILKSKQGYTVLTMLLDGNAFWRYDNRESLMNKP